MNAKIEAVKKFTGQGFVSGIVVAALVGERRNISPVSALRLRLGRLVWGTSTGLSKGGTAITLPDETFYEIADRGIGYAVSDQVQLNLIRAQMVRVEARVLKVAMMALFVLSAGVGAAAIFGEQIVQNFHFNFNSSKPTSISRLSSKDLADVDFVAGGDCIATHRFGNNREIDLCVKNVLSACDKDFELMSPENPSPPNLCFVKAARDYASSLN